MTPSSGRRSAVRPTATSAGIGGARTLGGERLVDVATTMHRLAVLLSAGLSPERAWRLVAESGHSIAAAVGAAPDPVDALVRTSAGMRARERSGWRALAALWEVATVSGAPLASALRHVADGVIAAAETERETAAALAGPSATARLVLALPLGAVLIATLLGLGSLEVLVGSGFGWGCLAVGATLVALAHRWTARLIARAASHEASPGLDCELMAVALSAGVSADRARRAVDDALARTGLPSRTAAVDDVLALCEAGGAPAGELLRAEAAERRRSARAAGRAAASVLAVRLMLPLGLCVLPAFVVVGVVPVLVGVISSTVGTLP